MFLQGSTPLRIPLHILMLSALMALSFRASADILVRFPKGVDVAYMSATAKEIEQQVGMHAVGVAEAETETEKSGAAPVLSSELTGLLDRARTAYKELHLKLTLEILTPAETLCLAHATYEGCRSFLFDAALLRGMTLDAMGHKEAAAQAFRSAHIVDPAQVVDPRRYPPDIVQSFAKACTTAKAAPLASAALVSVPAAATFSVDGQLVDNPAALALSSGLHIVHAHLLGFEEMWRVIEVDSAGKGPSPVRFELTELPHIDAWKSLIAHLSTPAWRPDDPGLLSLFHRFKIHAVVLLNRGTPSDIGLVAKIAVLPAGHLSELPSPGVPGAPLSEDFTKAVREAMGLTATPSVVPPPTGPLPPEVRPDEEEGAALEEDEDPSVRFQDRGDRDKEETTRKDKKLVKSPWLWISIGIVTAIVTGIVVATQVGD